MPARQRRLLDMPRATGQIIALHDEGPTEPREGAIIPLDAFGAVEDLRAGVVRSVPSSATAPASFETLKDSGLRSFINVPLLADGDLIGVLNVVLSRRGAFGPEAIEIAQQVASTLAVALRQAQLRERVERLRQRARRSRRRADRRSGTQREPPGRHPQRAARSRVRRRSRGALPGNPDLEGGAALSPCARR